MKHFAWLLAAIFGLTLAFGAGCKGSVVPELDSIERVVLNDLSAGDTLPQIEMDVAKMICTDLDASLMICEGAVEAVDAALTLLIATGVLPPVLAPIAKSMHATEKAKLSGAR